MSDISGIALRTRPMSLIGEGARGEVFVAMDEVLRRRVVVKKLLSRSFESAEARLRLIAEARTLAQIDHPNILRIHNYTDDQDYDVFTLEFAAGRTLTTELGERMDFAKKLRIATAVASALVIAHRHGIVHGALSTDSVLITDKGDIKLTDFASTTTRLEGRPRGATAVSAADAGTRTSDMYEFGFLLRELFGDRDRDVRTLIASLTREAPSERTTAAAALARLQRLASRKVRRIRIAAAALVAAFLVIGGTKYTIDLQRARSAAVAAQADAEEHRADANELASFMVQSLRPKLWSVGRLDIMDATTEKALAYFASMNPNEISAHEAAVNIEALVLLGETQLTRADLAAAHKTLEKAVTLAEAARRQHPNDLEVRFAAGYAYMMTSNEREHVGDVAGGLRQAHAASAVFNDLVQRKPDEVRFLRHQAWAYSNLGTQYDRMEELSASLANLEKAVAVKRRIVQLKNTLENQFDAAITVHKTGLAMLKVGRFGEAQTLLERERATLETLLARESTNRRMHQLLARFDDDLCAVAFATGDVSQALQRSESNLATSTQLASFDPDNVDWKLLLVVAHRGYGTAARMNGDINAALRNHQEAVDELNRLFARGRQNRQAQRDIATGRIELARSLVAAGRPRDAELQARLAIDAVSAMHSEMATKKIVADGLLVQGEALETAGDGARAAAVWSSALPIVEALDARSLDPAVTDTHARILLHLGRGDQAFPLIEQLSALGYRNREFEALCEEKGVAVQR